MVGSSERGHELMTIRWRIYKPLTEDPTIHPEGPWKATKEVSQVAWETTRCYNTLTPGY
jgi:hypothetical protein